ncbi:MAG: hypothetical protein IPP76_13030 [Moraxellaceae bacterium]|nr:hypothetical protein [Moraxellaceae bacterium]
MLLSEGMAQVSRMGTQRRLFVVEHQESKNWNVPLEQASGKLLYVGKTQKNLCERIKSHFGMKNLTVETFENHRWHSVPSISDDVKKSTFSRKNCDLSY